MTPNAALKAYTNKTVVTLKKNVQKIRATEFNWTNNFGALDPTKHAGKPLRIRYIDITARHPYVRVRGIKTSLTLQYPQDKKEKIPIYGIMIPVEAIKMYKN